MQKALGLLWACERRLNVQTKHITTEYITATTTFNFGMFVLMDDLLQSERTGFNLRQLFTVLL